MITTLPNWLKTKLTGEHHMPKLTGTYHATELTDKLINTAIPQYHATELTLSA
jgi:hypothetical protein